MENIKILNKEVNTNITDRSAIEFRDEVVTELEKLIEEPFAMSDYILVLQGQQLVLKQIIDYLKYVI